MFRTQQKYLEKELGALHTSATDLVSRTNSGEVDSEEALKALDGMMKRIEVLKRKVRPVRVFSLCQSD